MIRGKIDVTKIVKAQLFRGKKGTYLDIALIETPNDQYGNDYMIVQDPGKDARLSGEKGAILGNAKIVARRDVPQDREPPPMVDTGDGGGDGLPF